MTIRQIAEAPFRLVSVGLGISAALEFGSNLSAFSGKKPRVCRALASRLALLGADGSIPLHRVVEMLHLPAVKALASGQPYSFSS